MNFSWNRERSVTLKYCQGVKKRTVSECQTEVLSGSVKTKLLSVSITIKRTDRKCPIKIRPESATNETSTMECNNQIDR